MSLRTRIGGALEAEHGFTMIIAIGVMFVTSMLLVAAFTISNGDIQLSQDNTTQKQAYYAALAGIQEYEYQLQSNPDFWQTCKKLESNVAEAASEHYVVTPIVAESAPSTSKECSTENPFTSMIQSTGRFANTFRVKSVGEVQVNSKHKSTRTVIATFGVNGFLHYVYYTNYETVDPGIYAASNPGLAKECEGKYYVEWKGKACPVINFGAGDEIEGPMHTNDTSLVSGAAVFGRKGHEPKDVVEMYGGTYGSNAGCKGATYNTATSCYIEKGQGAEILTPPPNDESLAAYVESENEFEGETHLELKGKEISITYHNAEGTQLTKTIKWPANGLLYVKGNEKHACSKKYEVNSSDSSAEEAERIYCGDVYISGTYEKSLTVASGTSNVIVTGNLYPTGLKLATSGANATVPTGTAVLGLIADEYVRVYHPCSGGTNQKGFVSDPWIYAGVLATTHSWLVDNSNCGEQLGKLNVYGAIGQDYRGIVAEVSGSTIIHGYSKNYEYDERLATDEPPYFLAPLKAGWKIIRENSEKFG